MKSKASIASIFILFSVLLYSCGGNIPITGEDIPTPTDTAESKVVPTSTEIDQSSAEANGSSLATVLPETPACQTPTASVKVKNAYLRDGPDIRFVALAQYKNGDQFTVLGRYRDWFQAEAPDGKKGWVYKDWVTIPSSMDTSTICSIPVEELPPTPKTSQNDQKTPQSGEECVPTYYVSCP
mgnify:CR=1 FL=1